LNTGSVTVQSTSTSVVYGRVELTKKIGFLEYRVWLEQAY